MGDLVTPAEAEALWLSLRVSSVAILSALPIAFLTALLLSRRRFWGAGLVETVVHLPLVLPPVAVGYLLLVLFGGRGPVGEWLFTNFHIRFVFSWTGAALASALITFPLQVRAIRLALEAADPGLAAAARTLGAGAFDRLANITLPLALPGIVSGAITAFAASLGEFGAIITFVSNIPGETQTLPLAIYAALQSPGGEAAAARLCGLSILLAIIFVSLGDLAAKRIWR
ncbi:molybdate transport system permease protein [Rhizomicrobium palustre]|uniref:Molybdenum transport system permease n=1 Tax=Rhizomicrobium palustre TaxID=189966 RepID=A0A846MZ80_9PROT|nr:molybdate ABC transporter permease subunit [Rhizomicrobium palustre]NIK88559.1 molybdate transport system permease protein [Rhizomicrobium palustre]